MGKILHGHIERDAVIIEDPGEASALFNRSSTGYMVKGRLFLTSVEAFYLMNEGKLELDVSRRKFLDMALKSSDFQTRYMVYRELRKRGFLIRDDGFMYIWRGGEQKEKGEMRVFPVDEKNAFDFGKIYEMAEEISDGHEKESSAVSNRNIGTSEKRKSSPEAAPVIFAVVDGDGDVTYYLINRHFPKGPHSSDPEGSFDAFLMDDMGIMLEGFRELHDLFYGKSMDDALYLSTIECAYLMKKGILTLREGKKKVSFKSLIERASGKDPEIKTKLTIYSDLRERGLIVRTGFKYGTHFRVYVKDVEHHAKCLAHAVPENYTGTWPEISRGVRLAHGVKKEFLLAEASKNPRYLRIKRVRL